MHLRRSGRRPGTYKRQQTRRRCCHRQPERRPPPHRTKTRMAKQKCINKRNLRNTRAQCTSAPHQCRLTRLWYLAPRVRHPPGLHTRPLSRGNHPRQPRGGPRTHRPRPKRTHTLTQSITKNLVREMDLLSATRPPKSHVGSASTPTNPERSTSTTNNNRNPNKQTNTTTNSPPTSTQQQTQPQTSSHNNSSRRRGPCIHGHQFTTASISGTPIWYCLPAGHTWKEATAGDTLCGACWQKFCTYRRKRARTDDAIIIGLRNQPELNHTIATIITYDTTTARWLVDATARPGTILRLEAENLQQNTPNQPRKRRRNTHTRHTNNLDFTTEREHRSHNNATTPIQTQTTQTPQPQQHSNCNAASLRSLAATSTRRSRFRLRGDSTARPPGQPRQPEEPTPPATSEQRFGSATTPPPGRADPELLLVSHASA